MAVVKSMNYYDMISSVGQKYESLRFVVDDLLMLRHIGDDLENALNRFEAAKAEYDNTYAMMEEAKDSSPAEIAALQKKLDAEKTGLQAIADEYKTEIEDYRKHEMNLEASLKAAEADKVSKEHLIYIEMIKKSFIVNHDRVAGMPQFLIDASQGTLYTPVEQIMDVGRTHRDRAVLALKEMTISRLEHHLQRQRTKLDNLKLRYMEAQDKKAGFNGQILNEIERREAKNADGRYDRTIAKLKQMVEEQFPSAETLSRQINLLEVRIRNAIHDANIARLKLGQETQLYEQAWNSLSDMQKKEIVDVIRAVPLSTYIERARMLFRRHKNLVSLEIKKTLNDGSVVRLSMTNGKGEYTHTSADGRVNYISEEACAKLLKGESEPARVEELRDAIIELASSEPYVFEDADGKAYQASVRDGHAVLHTFDPDKNVPGEAVPIDKQILPKVEDYLFNRVLFDVPQYIRRELQRTDTVEAKDVDGRRFRFSAAMNDKGYDVLEYRPGWTYPDKGFDVRDVIDKSLFNLSVDDFSYDFLIRKALDERGDFELKGADGSAYRIEAAKNAKGYTLLQKETVADPGVTRSKVAPGFDVSSTFDRDALGLSADNFSYDRLITKALERSGDFEFTGRDNARYRIESSRSQKGYSVLKEGEDGRWTPVDRHARLEDCFSKQDVSPSLSAFTTRELIEQKLRDSDGSFNMTGIDGQLYHLQQGGTGFSVFRTEDKGSSAGERWVPADSHADISEYLSKTDIIPSVDDLSTKDIIDRKLKYSDGAFVFDGTDGNTYRIENGKNGYGVLKQQEGWFSPAKEVDFSRFTRYSFNKNEREEPAGRDTDTPVHNSEER